MDIISILLVDDHRLIRDSWLELLNSEPRFQVIGSASSAEEGIDIAMNKRPRIVLMDINMQPINGFDATKSIRKFSPGSRIIGVSMHALPVYAKKMMQVGAVGYVTKNSSREELIKAIIEVDAGNKYICEEVKSIISEQHIYGNRDNPDINNLSKRELEIAKLIRDGNSSREIAIKLDISVKTVEVHRHNSLKKLNLPNSASLVNFLNQHSI